CRLPFSLDRKALSFPLRGLVGRIRRTCLFNGLCFTLTLQSRRNEIPSLGNWMMPGDGPDSSTGGTSGAEVHSEPREPSAESSLAPSAL
ncbi:hypothetical protein A2U01_0010140, partial [Trifolium medium]|nr:hypothetical protein [Trifolium medium]